MKPRKRGRVGRFYFVSSKRSETIHLSHHITECYRTLCGIMIGWRTWRWARTRTAQRHAKQGPVCKKCLRAAPPIIVARVRRRS